MSVKSCYIHIPFCNKICSYCDFAKVNYNKLYIDAYLDSLSHEIDLYYNCLNKEHKINYLLDTEAYIRIKLILQNYIPQNLKKYIIEERKIQNEKEFKNPFTYFRKI